MVYDAYDIELQVPSRVWKMRERRVTGNASKVSMDRYRTLRRYLPWLGLIGASLFGAFFLWIAINRVEWAGVWAVLSHANRTYLLAAFGIFVVALFLRGFRWKLLFRGVPVSTRDLVLVETTAIGVNSITPIPVLDEPTRVGLLLIRGIPAGTVLATMAAMRTFELTIQAIIGAVGLFYLEPLRALAPYFIAAAVLAVLALVALFGIGPLLRRVPMLARLRMVRDFSLGVQLMRQAPWLTMLSLVMTALYALMIGLSGWMLGKAVDLPLGVLELTVISLAVIFFTDWIPGLPGAIGTFELVALYFLGLWGIPTSAAFGFAILLHILFFVPPLIVAALYLPYAGFRSVGAVMDLLRQRTPDTDVAAVHN